jgi:hypothetical protein
MKNSAFGFSVLAKAKSLKIPADNSNIFGVKPQKFIETLEFDLIGYSRPSSSKTIVLFPASSGLKYTLIRS